MTSTNDKDHDPKESNNKWLIIVGIIMVAASWFVNLGWGIWAMDNNATKGGEINIGQWGDIFGAVNALFSGATLVFLMYGIGVQRYEVKLAKAELKNSKDQAAANKAALDKQNETTERQMFENTFFKMLDDYNEIVGSLYCSTARNFLNEMFSFVDNSEDRINLSDKRVFKARSVFDEVSSLIDGVFIEDPFETYKRQSGYNDQVNNEADFDKKYETIDTALNGLLDRYFRTVYNILKFISLAGFEEKSKKFYSNILRAQMTDKETKVLAFNVAYKIGRQKFMPLVEELQFLKHCDNAKGEVDLLSKVIKVKAFK